MRPPKRQFESSVKIPVNLVYILILFQENVNSNETIRSFGVLWTKKCHHTESDSAKSLVQSLDLVSQQGYNVRGLRGEWWVWYPSWYPTGLFGSYSRSSVQFSWNFVGRKQRLCEIGFWTEKSENPKKIRKLFFEVAYPKVCQNFQVPNRRSRKKIQVASSLRSWDMSNYPVFKKSGFSQKAPAKIRSKSIFNLSHGLLYHPALNVSRSKFSGFWGPSDPLWEGRQGKMKHMIFYHNEAWSMLYSLRIISRKILTRYDKGTNMIIGRGGGIDKSTRDWFSRHMHN